MNIIYSLAKSYKEHDCFNLAANISFFAILSLIPLLMIVVSAAGFVIGSSEELFSQIVSAVTDVLPKGKNELAASLNSIIYGRSSVGGIGIVFLLFIASLLFSSVEHALDKIFQSVKRRNFFHSRLLSVLLVFGVISVLFLPAAIGVFQAVLARFSVSVPLSGLASDKIFLGFLMIASFVAAVMIIPSHKVQFRFAVAGSIFFAVCVGAARFLFRLYIAYSFDRYNVIYGSLTVLVVAVIWIYYLANIFLLSSELVAVLQRRYSKWQMNEADGGRGQAS